jgi:hypothetical protein
MALISPAADPFHGGYSSNARVLSPDPPAHYPAVHHGSQASKARRLSAYLSQLGGQCDWLRSERVAADASAINSRGWQKVRQTNWRGWQDRAAGFLYLRKRTQIPATMLATAIATVT